MNYIERRERTIARARKLGDKAALAILEADRRHTPDPEHPVLRRIGPVGRLEALWHAA